MFAFCIDTVLNQLATPIERDPPNKFSWPAAVFLIVQVWVYIKVNHLVGAGSHLAFYSEYVFNMSSLCIFFKNTYNLRPWTLAR